MKILILVSGKAQSGKDSIGEYLVFKYGFKRYAFADRLKEVAIELGWDGEKDFAGRKFLQEFGSVVRNYDPDTWVNIVLNGIKKDLPDRIVITDCRYANEYVLMSEFARSNGYVFIPIKIFRPGVQIDGILSKHESEREFEQFPGIAVKNDGTLEELHEKIDFLISEGVLHFVEAER